MSITEASNAKQQDLRAYQRGLVKGGRRSTVGQTNQGAGGYQPELMGNPVIR